MWRKRNRDDFIASITTAWSRDADSRPPCELLFYENRMRVYSGGADTDLQRRGAWLEHHTDWRISLFPSGIPMPENYLKLGHECFLSNSRVQCPVTWRKIRGARCYSGGSARLRLMIIVLPLLYTRVSSVQQSWSGSTISHPLSLSLGLQLSHGTRLTTVRMLPFSVQICVHTGYFSR